MTYIKLFEKLLSMEEDLNLFSFTIDGVRFWERIRNRVYQAIIGKSNKTTKKLDSVGSKFKIFKRFIFSIFNFYKNPFLVPNCQILFFGSGRRILEKDGFWWHLYFDPIIEGIQDSAIVVETDYKNNHFTPAKSPTLRYYDFVEFLTYLKRVLGVTELKLKKNERILLNKIRKEILSRFAIDVDVEKLTYKILERRKSRVPLLRWMLRLIQPRIIFVVQGYGREDLIEASKSIGIPIAELQHGLISPYQPGYSFEGEFRKKITFPDYLLVFGDYWKSVAKYPIEEKKVVSVGYPYFEMKNKNYADVAKKRQIIFISQDTIGKDLSKFAAELIKIDELDYEILYKLHPQECDGWRNRYPWLKSSDIKVVDNRGVILHELFAKSMIQVGVYSTALYEGLAYGLQTYIVDKPGSEYFMPLVKGGYVKLVSSPEELVNDIKNKSETQKIDHNYFFKSNAVSNITSFLTKFIKLP